MKIAIINFPGTNCERDVATALEYNFPQVEVKIVWHRESEQLLDYSALILPGGYSYGDILRPGAIASHSPIFRQIERFAELERGPILGICNGFQILCEAGLLPGTLWLNNPPRFICQPQLLRVENTESPFTSEFSSGEIIQMPIANIWGSYQINRTELKRLRANRQIAFTYLGNPNNSTENIAGVLSENRKILGLMPHPERSALPWLKSEDGLKLFQSMINYIANSNT